MRFFAPVQTGPGAHPSSYTMGTGLFLGVKQLGPIPVAARSKAWVYGRSLTRIVGSNPTGGMDVCVVLYKDSSMEHK